MKRDPFGTYIETTTLGETVRAFLPPTLPPNPPLAFTAGSQTVLDRAMLSLGRLDSAAATMPDMDLLLYTFIRKEAVLSSQIEGTQSTLDELLAMVELQPLSRTMCATFCRQQALDRSVASSASAAEAVSVTSGSGSQGPT